MHATNIAVLAQFELRVLCWRCGLCAYFGVSSTLWCLLDGVKRLPVYSWTGKHAHEITLGLTNTQLQWSAVFNWLTFYLIYHAHSVEYKHSTMVHNDVFRECMEVPKLQNVEYNFAGIFSNHIPKVRLCTVQTGRKTTLQHHKLQSGTSNRLVKIVPYFHSQANCTHMEHNAADFPKLCGFRWNVCCREARNRIPNSAFVGIVYKFWDVSTIEQPKLELFALCVLCAHDVCDVLCAHDVCDVGSCNFIGTTSRI